jgi:hypothetical protein
VQRVHQVVHPTGSPTKAPPGAYGRETASMWHMQEALQQHVQPQDPLAATFRTETVRVRPLPSQVYAVRPPQATQAVAHQRAALHVRRVPEEVHQR